MLAANKSMSPQTGPGRCPRPQTFAPIFYVILTTIANEGLRNLGPRQHEIGSPAHDGAAGHVQWLRQAQSARRDCQTGTRWIEMDMVALHQHAVGDLHNLHRRVGRKKFDHHAFMFWIKMLDQHKGHAAVRRQGSEQLPECVEAACRGSESNDGEIDTRVA